MIFRNRNQKEQFKQDLKLKLRALLPQFILNVLRRRQVPLDKMREFLKTHRSIPYSPHFDRLAIVVPCYGHEKYLPDAFESIISQTELPDEVIFVDDGSPDNTAAVITELIANYEKINAGSIRFNLHRNSKNLGQSAAINKGVELAESDLVMVLNDDDYLMNDLVEVTKFLFKNNPDLALLGGSNIAFRSMAEITPDAKKISSFVKKESIKLRITTPADAINFEDYCSLNMTHTGSTFVKPKAIAAGLYYPYKKDRIVHFSDRDFQIRLNLLYPAGTTSEIPFCFWRNDSSVDNGRFT
jgi:glycosyltransferase involved in cell wall biosynthesis